ncbi:MAG: OPT/YSL family transporter, partial [Fidelibacterota bacterium]
MADPQRGWLREVFKSEYREVTPEAILLGILFGAFMTASFTYAGMVLGFTLGGSTVAAILGWGVLRAILKKGTIVENNINQTVASGINIAHSGIIFTVPVLYLRNIDFNPFLMLLGTIAGAVLGVAFIIPIRKQMIDLERLRFPTGTAVATILKSPGSGVKKSLYLVYGLAFGGTLYFITQFPLLGLPRIIPETIDLGRLIGLPPYVANVWAISVFALGAGYITGRVGLVVLAGGVLSYWIITPVAVNLGWIPSGAEAIEIAHNNMTRPLGIGMLIGGALTGIIVSSGSIKTALSSLRKMEISGKSPEERPLKFLYSSAIIAFIILFIAAYFTAPIGILKALLIALVGTAW